MRMVRSFEKELSQIPLPRMHRARLDLLEVEVMCHDDSELANQVTKQNGKSARFGLPQGDLLSTKEARQKLFTQMVCERLKNVWYTQNVSHDVSGTNTMKAEVQNCANESS